VDDVAHVQRRVGLERGDEAVGGGLEARDEWGGVNCFSGGAAYQPVIRVLWLG
jgi:hypothetical protein